MLLVIKNDHESELTWTSNFEILNEENLRELYIAILDSYA